MGREQELAERVVEWLSRQGWDVYHEVRLYQDGRIADIVARCNRLVWVVETKTSLSIAALDQAHDWTYEANFVSVATKQSRRKSVIFPILEHLGLGLIGVGHSVESECNAPMRRIKNPRLLECLHDDHKTWAAPGNADNEYWTPFRHTCNTLARHVKKNEGCALKDAIGSMPHHYSSDKTAISSLAKWIRLGRVDGLRVEREGRLLRVFSNET